MSKPVVAVLGCGPTGLLVAHAVALSGRRPVIYSKKKPSNIGGAQFLHKEIEGLTRHLPDGAICVDYRGNAEGYATKVYGDPNAETSWGLFSGMMGVWNLRSAYKQAWELYKDDIVDVDLEAGDVWSLSKWFPIFSTIPARVLCTDPRHVFRSQEVWITGEFRAPPDRIVYNGDMEFPWYRSSLIFGTPGTEYGFKPDTPEKAVRVVKPISTNCDCMKGKIWRFGRYGRWDKHQLAHHGFAQAVEVLEGDYALH